MIVVVGGTYRERCVQPRWDALYGSAGRAAAALSYLHETQLVTYVGDESRRDLEVLATNSGVAGFALDGRPIPATVSFDYVHPLSVPVIQPPPQLLKSAAALTVRGATVLRFGMMESTAIVEGDRVVYDPQSAYAPESFRRNGSKAGALAIVANGYEVQLMTGESDPERGGRALLAVEGAQVVVVKRGSRGAMVITEAGARFDVPAYRTPFVFSIGSGDMFAAAFTFFWAVESKPPERAAKTRLKGHR